MFFILPTIYYMQKVTAKTEETKALLRTETMILVPSIRKRGFFKTISRMSSGAKESENEPVTDFSTITPYPSKRVEEVVDEIIDEVIKYYVLPYAEMNNWKFKRTQIFIKRFLKSLLSEVSHRMSVIEWNEFLCLTTLDFVRSHLHFLKSRSFQKEPGCNFFMGQKTENLFVESIANRLLRSLVDKRYIQCELIYQFNLGLFAHQVIQRTIDYFADPEMLNQWVFDILIQRRLSQQKSRMGVGVSGKQFAQSGSSSMFQYDMSYEDFFKLIGSIHDTDELRKIRQKLQKEIRMVEILREGQQASQSGVSSKQKMRATVKKLTVAAQNTGSSGGSADISSNVGSVSGASAAASSLPGANMSQRELKTYRNQLKVLRNTVEKRLVSMLPPDIVASAGMHRHRHHTISAAGSHKRKSSTASAAVSTTGAGISNISKMAQPHQSFSHKIRAHLAVKGLLNTHHRQHSFHGGTHRSSNTSGSSLSHGSKGNVLSECISYETVMESNEGRKFFKEFLNATVQSRAVELVELLIHFQQHPHERYVIAQGIMKRYIHSSPPAFEFDKQIVKEMEEFLRGNMSEEVFIRARHMVDKELKHQWYTYFILSPYYAKFAKILTKDRRAADQMKLEPGQEIEISDCEPAETGLDSCDETGDESRSSDSSQECSEFEDDQIILGTEKGVPLPGNEGGAHLMLEGEDESEGCDKNSRRLLFDFTQSIQLQENPGGSLEIVPSAAEAQDVASSSAGSPQKPPRLEYYEEEEEEEDGFLKPRVAYGDSECFDDVELLGLGLRRINKRIEEKEKARVALVEVVSRMPLSRAEKQRMNSDLLLVETDLQKLRKCRAAMQYHMMMMGRWRTGQGRWGARVYDVSLPEPRRGASVDLGRVEGTVEVGGALLDDEDHTKQVQVVVMLGLGMNMTTDVTANSSSVVLSSLADDDGEEELGWLVKHTLKDFQILRRELSHLNPSIEKVSLPKIPQRLFLRRKYTENDLEKIKESLNKFLKIVMCDQKLAESRSMMNFFCTVVNDDSGAGTDESMLSAGHPAGPLHQLATTITDAGVKVMRFPGRLVQRVLLMQPQGRQQPPIAAAVAVVAGPEQNLSESFNAGIGYASSGGSLLNGAGGVTGGGDKRGSLRARRNSGFGSSRRSKNAAKAVPGQTNTWSSGSTLPGLQSSSVASKDVSMATFELIEELIQLRKSMTLTRRSLMLLVQGVFGRNLSQLLLERVAMARQESSVFCWLQAYRDSYRVCGSSSGLDPETLLLSVSVTTQQQTPEEAVASSPTMSRARVCTVGTSSGAAVGGGPGNVKTVSCENLASYSADDDSLLQQQQPQLSQQQQVSHSSWPYKIQPEEAAKRLVWDIVPESWRALLGNVNVADLVGFVFESCQSRPANKAILNRFLHALVDELLVDDELEPLN